MLLGLAHLLLVARVQLLPLGIAALLARIPALDTLLQLLQVTVAALLAGGQLLLVAIFQLLLLPAILLLALGPAAAIDDMGLLDVLVVLLLAGHHLLTMLRLGRSSRCCRVASASSSVWQKGR